MKANVFRRYLPAVALALLALLPACGGGDTGGLFDGLTSRSKTFYATNLSTDSYDRIPADQVGEGEHCYIFLESGRTVTQAAIDNLVAEFDTRIYPTVTNFFGSEPRAGADGDPKIYILLMGIRQPASAGIVGLFDSRNEYPNGIQSDARNNWFRIDYSNQKEMFYVDIVQQNLDNNVERLDVLRTLAHEFQHMVHWEQKDHLRLNLLGSDDTWLNEAMSAAAEIRCYGPSPGRLENFTSFLPSLGRSPAEIPLTGWGNSWMDYAKVAVWSQYLIDRYPDNVFRLALQSPRVGQASIDDALVGTGKTFIDVFREWTIANLFAGASDLAGVRVVPPDHPEWSYASIGLSGLFWPADNTLLTLPRFSSTYVRYVTSDPSGVGNFQWLPASSQTSATLIDRGGNLYYPDLVPGTIYPYLGEALLVVRNATGTDNVTSAGDNVVNFSLPPASASARSRALPSIGTRSKPEAAPVGGNRKICGTLMVIERDRWLLENGLRVDF